MTELSNTGTLGSSRPLLVGITARSSVMQWEVRTSSADCLP